MHGSSQSLGSRTVRVRTHDCRLRLAGTCRHGGTSLAILVDALEHTDIIVHVTECWLVDGAYSGDTQFVGTAGGQRYLRIRLDVRLHDEAAIAMLGHELQHAWEIATHPWVSDQMTLAELYERIG